MKNDIKWSARINADIKLSEYALSPLGNPTNDEAILNQSAYHAQQAIEKCLKFYLSEVYGEDSNSRKFKIHDISSLCARLVEHGYEPIPRIKRLSDEITDWEANSRYGLSFVSSKESIKEVLSYAKRMKENIELLEEKIAKNVEISNDDIDIILFNERIEDAKSHSNNIYKSNEIDIDER